MATLPHTKRTFLYLNRENQWRDFHLHSVEIGTDGAVRLASLPKLEGDVPGVPDALHRWDVPAGMAIAPDGTLYFSAPALHLVLKISPCALWHESDDHDARLKQASPHEREEDGPSKTACSGARAAETVLPPNAQEPFAPLPCMGGYGKQPTQFDLPRGLLFHVRRHALFVADSGNGRIQIFEPGSYQLLDIWSGGRTGAEALSRPWMLAGDTEGAVYVVDAGSDENIWRVLKLDPYGISDVNFWMRVQETLDAQGLALGQVGGIATAQVAGREYIFLLDAQYGRLLQFELNGTLRGGFAHDGLRGAVGLAVNDRAIFVGNRPQHQVWQYGLDGTFVGAARGYKGDVGALLLDGNCLWVHAGGDEPPVRLLIDRAFVRRGFLWGGPFTNYSQYHHEWHRLVAQIDAQANTHYQVFVFASADPDAEPGLTHGSTPPWHDNSIDLEVHLRADQEGDWSDMWIRLPPDVPEAVFRALLPVQRRYGAPSGSEGWTALGNVWVGVAFWGEGDASPALRQMQLDFDYVSYLQHLPPIYSEDTTGRQTMARFLSLLARGFEPVEGTIGALPALFDPAAVRMDWLPWLAQWLDVPLHDTWDEARKRESIAEAFARHGQRGTRLGLQETIRRDLGVDVVIDEPIVHAAWWSLPEDSSLAAGDERSVLGFTTMLVGGEPQGAVVGSSATLDHSHLITAEEFGAPLFQELAHRFTVRVYRGSHLVPGLLEMLAAILDREKPAHTTYHLCLVEPGMRVGFQAHVGIDTVIAGDGGTTQGGEATRLGHVLRSGDGVVLGGERAGRIGQQSRIGDGTRLGIGPR
jgi:phage tail-like protein